MNNSNASQSLLIIGNHAPPFGGVPKVVSYLAEQLSNSGWRVSVLSPKPALEITEVFGGYTVHRAPRAFGKRDKLRLLLKNVVRTADHWKLFLSSPGRFCWYLNLFEISESIIKKNNIQVVHAHHLFPAGITAYWLHQKYQLPLVTTLYGEIYRNKRFYLNHITLVHRMIAANRKLTSCSNHCGKSLKSIGLKTPVETVYAGIDLNQFHLDVSRECIRKRLSINFNDFIVLFVGRMVEEMGLGTFLDAVPKVLATCPDTVFFIAGRKGALYPLATACKQSFPENIHIFCDVPEDELPLYYAGASVTVIPSTNERACLGLSIVESMASGTPVVVSDMGGGPEVCPDESAGMLFEPGDSDALAGCVLKMRTRTEKENTMAKAGRRRAVELFDQKQINIRFEGIFNECLGE